MSETSGVPSAGVGDVVLLADVGNSRIKLALVSRPAASDGGRLVGLPTISGRRDIDTGSLRADHLRGWLRMVAPGPAVVLIASVHDAAAAILEMVLAEESATGRRPLRQRRIGHGAVRDLFFHQREITHTPQKPPRNTRRAARPVCNLPRAILR